MLFDCFEEFMAYYRALPKASSGVPSRADFCPSKIRHLLPWIYIINRCPAGTYSYGLAGTALESLFQESVAGSDPLNLCATGEDGFTKTHMDTLLDTPCGGISERELYIGEHNVVCIHSLVLPLQDRTTDDVNKLVGIAAMPKRPVLPGSLNESPAYKATVRRTKHVEYIDLLKEYSGSYVGARSHASLAPSTVSAA